MNRLKLHSSRGGIKLGKKKLWKHFKRCQVCMKKTWTIKAFNPKKLRYEYICDDCFNANEAVLNEEGEHNAD